MLFIDSDIIVQGDTLRRLVRAFKDHEDVDAVMVVYSLNQRDLNFCSQYKNYYVRYKVYRMHRFTSTPISALLAVKKDAFRSAGEFNPGLVTGEDIEFGHRFLSVILTQHE